MTTPKLKVIIPSPSYSNNLILNINENRQPDSPKAAVSINRSIALQYQLKKRPKYTSSRVKEPNKLNKTPKLLIESTTSLHSKQKKKTNTQTLKSSQSQIIRSSSKPLSSNNKSVHPPHHPFPYSTSPIEDDIPSFFSSIKLTDKSTKGAPDSTVQPQQIKSTKSKQYRIRSPKRVKSKKPIDSEPVHLTVDCKKKRQTKHKNSKKNSERNKAKTPKIAEVESEDFKNAQETKKSIQINIPVVKVKKKKKRNKRIIHKLHLNKATNKNEEEDNGKVMIALGRPLTIPHLKGKWKDLLPNMFPPSSAGNSRPTSAKEASKPTAVSARDEKSMIKSQSSVMFYSLINNKDYNQQSHRSPEMPKKVKKKKIYKKPVSKTPLNDPSFCRIKHLINKLSKNNVRSLESLHRSINRARSVPRGTLKRGKLRNLHSLRRTVV